MREGENVSWNYSELRKTSWLFVSERLVESLRLPQVPTLHSQVFLFFRVLLLRMSPQHLTSLWPTMITELVSSNVSWIKFAFALIVSYSLLLQFLPTYVCLLHHSHSWSIQCSLLLFAWSFRFFSPPMRMRTQIKEESESMLYWHLMVIQITLWLKFCN